MDPVLEAIGRHGIVPVVVIDDGAAAPALAEALSAGGLPVAEFTFRTAAAVDAIRLAVAAHPDALVGAGSVSDPGQVDAAVDAGARFRPADRDKPRARGRGRRGAGPRDGWNKMTLVLVLNA